MEYDMFKRNQTTQVKVPYKYFNEINERDPEECREEAYLAEIITNIL